jgi:hypothetical protein
MPLPKLFPIIGFQIITEPQVHLKIHHVLAATKLSSRQNSIAFLLGVSKKILNVFGVPFWR